MSTSNEELLEAVSNLTGRLDKLEGSLENKLDEIIKLLKELNSSK